MPLEYNAKDAVTVWPDGKYPATLVKVEDATSKKKPDGSGGNPMQVWTFKVFDDVQGREQLISDYVVIPAATFKIKQLAAALGEEQAFNDGYFQADNCIEAAVTVELKTESTPGFDDKNRIKKILPAAQAAAPTPPARQPQRQSQAERILDAHPVKAGANDAPPIDNESIPF